jgi:3-hydroxyacyl-CoA dehydrogenase
MSIPTHQPTPGGKTEPPAIRVVGVVGAGVMGSGIVQWCAARGLQVLLCDNHREALQNAMTVAAGSSPGR